MNVVLIRPALGVLLDGDERWHALTLDEQFAHAMARCLGRDHPHVDPLRRHDLLEVNVEAMRPDQRLSRRDLRQDVVFEDASLLFVRHEHDDDIALLRGIGHLGDLEARLFGRRP